MIRCQQQFALSYLLHDDVYSYRSFYFVLWALGISKMCHLCRVRFVLWRIQSWGTL